MELKDIFTNKENESKIKYVMFDNGILNAEHIEMIIYDKGYLIISLHKTQYSFECSEYNATAIINDLLEFLISENSNIFDLRLYNGEET